MIGIVIISKGDAIMFVMLGNAENHMTCGELVGTTECVTLQTRCCTNQGCYSQVHQYNTVLSCWVETL